MEAHSDRHAVYGAVGPGMQGEGLDSGQCLECYHRFVGKAVVMHIFGHAPASVAAHTGFGTVGIENAHSEIGHFRRENKDYAVGTHACVGTAHLYRKLLNEGGSSVGAMHINVIIAYSMHFGEQHLLSVITISGHIQSDVFYRAQSYNFSLSSSKKKSKKSLAFFRKKYLMKNIYFCVRLSVTPD